MGIDLMMCIDLSILNDKFYCVLIVKIFDRNSWIVCFVKGRIYDLSGVVCLKNFY